MLNPKQCDHKLPHTKSPRCFESEILGEIFCEQTMTDVVCVEYIPKPDTTIEQKIERLMQAVPGIMQVLEDLEKRIDSIEDELSEHCAREGYGD
jgi:hypothetical protein